MDMDIVFYVQTDSLVVKNESDVPGHGSNDVVLQDGKTVSTRPSFQDMVTWRVMNGQLDNFISDLDVDLHDEDVMMTSRKRRQSVICKDVVQDISALNEGSCFNVFVLADDEDQQCYAPDIQLPITVEPRAFESPRSHPVTNASTSHGPPQWASEHVMEL
ncbi:hypothetical protein V6N12_038630 [Hibiscus sabdariffa]|uniref:Uncharacterized protein n=1 Tax=Hibiscus sabdariffa TaxID=183260 RepID=A0ABR2ATF3_9ROSI